MAKVKQALSATGFDDKLYLGHRFRIGAATTAAAAGVSEHLIKLLSQWESLTYQLLLCADQSQKLVDPLNTILSSASGGPSP